MIEDAIPPVVGNAMCGGWNATRTMEGDPGNNDDDLISVVTGVPGRAHLYPDQALSGMAKRKEFGEVLNDGYHFPDGANGFVTACPFDGGPTVTKTVWMESGDPRVPGGPGQKEVENIFPLPKDPPCLWRRGGELPPPHTPQKCADLCPELNTFKYMDCRRFQNVWNDKDGNWVGNFPEGGAPPPPPPVVDEEGNETPVEDPGYNVIGQRCAPDGWEEKYLCTDKWVTPDPGEGDKPNCKPCTGEKCRCPGPGCESVETQKGEQRTYRSYYRKYIATTKRGKLDEVPDDQLAEVTAPIACYGFYNEFDAKFFMIMPKDRQCVIDFPHARNDDNEWAEPPQKGLSGTQAGKGTLEPAAKQEDELPPLRNPAYDKKKDLWYPNLGGGLSFLSEPVFTRNYAQKLALTFFNTDIGQMVASKQHSATGSTAAMSRLRAAEDTASNQRFDAHTVETWWNKFLTDMGRLINPAVMRLRLPSALATVLRGLPPEVLGEVSGSGGTVTLTVDKALRSADRWESIDVQLDAKDDLLGFISAALRQTFMLRVQQVPVVYPLGSPESYRALSQRWEDYKNQRKSLTSAGGEELGDGGDYPEDAINALQERLEEYAVRAEEYRQLRNELPRYISKLLDKQRELTIGMQTWSNENLRRYKAFLEARAKRLEYAEKVRKLQSLYAKYSDQAGQPWCYLAHFTTPVYSLLDPWLPGRPALDGGVPICDPEKSATSLPMLCIPRNERELVLDLRNLRNTLSSLNIPVPMPVGVQFQLPTPPDPQDTPPKADALKLPVLPEVPLFSEEIIDRLPVVDVRSIPSLVPDPVKIDLKDVDKTLEKATSVVEGMDAAYRSFYNNVEPQEYTAKLWCEHPGIAPCWYVENELIQIMTRLTAMPLVYVREHRGLELPGFVTCDPRDRACLELHPERRYRTDGWQIIGPADAEEEERKMLEELRKASRETTIDGEGKLRKDGETPFPYAAPAIDLYPVFSVPPETPLDLRAPVPASAP